MKQARIAASAYVAPGAQIVGDVTLGEQSSVWYNAVLRGDCAPITVGCRTNLQDGVTVHCTEGVPTAVGNGVTVGHNAILHSCTVGNDSLIGGGDAAHRDPGRQSGRGISRACQAPAFRGGTAQPARECGGIPGALRRGAGRRATLNETRKALRQNTAGPSLFP